MRWAPSGMLTSSKQFDGAVLGLVLVHAHVEFQSLGDLAADGEHRVEGGHGVLKDHGDLFAADLADAFLAQLEQIAAHKDRLAGGDLARRFRDEPQEGHDAHALAATALAYNREGLALVEIVRDAVDGLDHPVLGVEPGFEAFYLEQCRCHTGISLKL